MMAINQEKEENNEEEKENDDVINSTNFPNISCERTNGNRIVMLHKNVEGMLSNITDILSKSHINIERLSNKGRGDIAYTIIDFENNINEDILKEIEKIDNVLNVRFIK